MADQNVLEVQGGIREQGSDETRAWSIDLSNICSAPASPTIVRAVSETDPSSDLQSTLFPTGNPTISDTTTLNLPLLTALTAGTMYRVYATVVDSGNTLLVFARFWCPVHSTTPQLVTVPMMLEVLESDWPGAEIQRLIDGANADIVHYCGPHTFSGDITRTIQGGHEQLFLPRQASAIVSVTEFSDWTVAATSYTLTSNDWRLRYDGRALLRLTGGDNPGSLWRPQVTVVFTPADHDAQRRQAIMDLVRLACAYQPGIGSERVGDYGVVFFGKDYHQERAAIIRRLMPKHAGGGLLV